MSKLPVFPSVALQSMKMISQDDVSLFQLGELLKTDAALSTELLRAANSAMFGNRTEIKSIPMAVSTLGMDRLSVLILTTAMWRMSSGSSRQNLRLWWRHNLATALMCQHLMKSEAGSEYAYMAGIMHSVGQLALFESHPVGYANMLHRIVSVGASLIEAERQRFGVDHCMLGAALMRTWNIPAELVDSVAHHHDPENAEHRYTKPVYMSCQVANQIGFAVAPGPRKPHDQLSPETLALLQDSRLCAHITERVDALEASLLS